ncbi:MAG: hypothetical protein ACR2PL_05825 [Dehalococcoidia bacterium]
MYTDFETRARIAEVEHAMRVERAERFGWLNEGRGQAAAEHTAQEGLHRTLAIGPYRLMLVWIRADTREPKWV